MVDTGKKIKELRIRAGLTQKELGTILSVSYQAVSKWERGMGLPDAALFPQIAKALGTDVNTLFYSNAPKTEQKSAYKPINDKFLAIFIAALTFFLMLATTFTIVIVRKNRAESAIKTASIIFNNEENVQVLCDFNGQTVTFTRKYFFDGRVIMCYDQGDTQYYFYKDVGYKMTALGLQSAPITAEDYLSALPDFLQIDFSDNSLKDVNGSKGEYSFKLKTTHALGVLESFGFSPSSKIKLTLKDSRIKNLTVTEGNNALALNYTYGYGFTFSLPDFLN